MMANSKNTNSRGSSASSRNASSRTAPNATATSSSEAKTDDSIVAKTGRTLKERPFTSAAIATGAVAAAAAVGAAGAFLYARREKGFKEASDELAATVKGGIASATESVKGGIASASETVKGLADKGSDYLKGDDARGGRTQAEIAQEALTLKQLGDDKALDDLSGTEIKTGAIAY
jgi:hypothetical protein